MCALALLASAVGWVAFCVTTKPGPGAVGGAHTFLLLMSLASLPMLSYARRFLLDASAGGEVAVGENVLSIILPRTLRRPIKLHRTGVAGVIIDAEAVANADERLRFSVDGGASYLYSSIGGSVLPILGAERAVPNLAIVFDQPLKFSEPRRRFFGLSDFLPLRPLQPSSPAPGVMLRVADPVSASLQLASWNDPDRVRLALSSAPSANPPGHQPDGLARNVPPLRQPLSREHAKRATWPSLLLVGVVFALVYAGRHASFSLGREVLLAVGFAFFLSGGVLDTRLRNQERGGFARVMSVGLAGTGLMMVMAVTALSTTHS